MARDVWGTYLTDADYEAAAQRGINKKTVDTRIYRAWSAKRAITEPLKHPNARCPEYKKFRQIALNNGINEKTFQSRVTSRKWPLEEAANTPALSSVEASRRACAAPKTNRRTTDEILKTAAENGINKNTFYSRLNTFWNPLEAATVPTNSRNAGRDYIRKLNSRIYKHNNRNRTEVISE